MRVLRGGGMKWIGWWIWIGGRRGLGYGLWMLRGHDDHLERLRGQETVFPQPSIEKNQLSK